MDQASNKALTGWWSNKAETRFEMNFDLDPEKGAAAFVVSNPPPLLLCVNYANLEVCTIIVYTLGGVRGAILYYRAPSII